jgi:hypothetical protein
LWLKKQHHPAIMPRTMANHTANSTPSVQQQQIDAASGKSKDKAWPVKHRFTYVLIAAIIGFLALTFKEWVSDEWRSLHDDIAQSEAVFRIQLDIAESTKTLRHAMAVYAGKKYATCASGGGLDGNPNPPEKYDGHCDDLVAALDIDLKAQRHAVKMDSDFAVHAGLPMTEGFKSVDADLKSAEQRFAQLVKKVDDARMEATSRWTNCTLKRR